MPNRQSMEGDKRLVLSSTVFRRKFLGLILLTWFVPAIIGMAFLLYIKLFTFQQLWLIQSRPLEPLFVLATVGFAYWYFRRFSRPITHYLDNPDTADPEPYLQCMRRFPLHYWGLFLVYLLLAPIVVITAAELYSDYVSRPIDWFRIHLTALIVSIIVGLPIFFLILDLFGRTLHDVKLIRPHITLKVKVFLIGALIPLLIDTMLVQYYWTRTNYFTIESFVVWISLELLAIAGSLIFVRSFGQSLSPLQRFIGATEDTPLDNLEGLTPRSTDELGVLAADYRKLLEDLRIKSEILELNIRLLRDSAGISNVAKITKSIIKICEQAIIGDIVFLFLHDKTNNELVCIIQTGTDYNPDGHFRLSLDEVSMAVMVFKQNETSVINDVPNDPRCSPRMITRFKINSALAVPLRVDDEAIGVLLSMCNTQYHQYTERELMLMEGMAREAAIAIHAQQLNTDREYALQELHKAESILKLVLDTIPARVYWKDKDCVYLGCNRLFAKDAGLNNPRDIVGKRDTDLTWKDQAAQFCLDDKDIMQSGEPYLNFQELRSMSAGNQIWLEASKVPLTDSDGTVIGLLGIYQDITKRKHDEEELLKHRENLEELVKSRTDELSAVNKELESFSYSVSHDLRAPLRSIDGFSQAILEDYEERLDDTGKDYLQRLRASAQHMATLIQDLLELARVTRGELARKRINLTSIAKEILDNLQQEEPARNVKINISSDLFAEADPQLTNVLLDNLIRNAWKYSSKLPEAIIEVGSTTSQGTHAYFVRDNGAGFDKKYADKLFGAFQRLHHRDEFEGTGIGLAIVQRIVHRHGGHIWAESEVGKGATFFFTFGK